MCVIVTQPKGTYLDKATAANQWYVNPDGAGFAYIDENNEMVLEKYMTFDEFWPAFERARADHRGQDFLLHFRIATHGSICLDNVHPFVVNNNTVMAHNGIIHGVPVDKETDRSDTRMFIDTVLPHLAPTWLDNRFLVTAIEEEIGWSKLAFLTNDPQLEKNLYILNEDAGETWNGMWFSNNHGLPSKSWQSRNNRKATIVDVPEETKLLPRSTDGATRLADIEAAFDCAQEDSIFSDWYPKDWILDPSDPNLTTAEATSLWLDVSDELASLSDMREKWHGMTLHHNKISFDARTLRISCNRCLSEVTMSGECDCLVSMCSRCDLEMFMCKCPLPRKVNLVTGEVTQTERTVDA